MWYYLAIVGQTKKVKLLSVLSSTGHLQIGEIKLNSHLKMSVLQHSNCWYTTNKLHQQSLLCVMISRSRREVFSSRMGLAGWSRGTGETRGGCWLAGWLAGWGWKLLQSLSSILLLSLYQSLVLIRSRPDRSPQPAWVKCKIQKIHD